MRRLIAGLLLAALPAMTLAHYYIVRTIEDPISTTSAPVLGTRHAGITRQCFYKMIKRLGLMP